MASKDLNKCQLASPRECTSPVHSICNIEQTLQYNPKTYAKEQVFDPDKRNLPMSGLGTYVV